MQLRDLQSQNGSTRASVRASLKDTPSFEAFNLQLRAFEQILLASRVYQRVEDRSEIMSFSSSIPRYSVLSYLSKCSLGNISILSVVALPVCIPELSLNPMTPLRIVRDGPNREKRNKTWDQQSTRGPFKRTTESGAYPPVAWLYDPADTPTTSSSATIWWRNGEMGPLVYDRPSYRHDLASEAASLQLSNLRWPLQISRSRDRSRSSSCTTGDLVIAREENSG